MAKEPNSKHKTTKKKVPIKSVPINHPLTPRQKEFCRLYTIYFDVQRAAREAGYSPKTAQSQGSQQLMRPNCKAVIDKLLKNSGEQQTRLKKKILNSLESIIDFDLTSLIASDGTISNFQNIPPEVLTGIRVTKRANQATLFSKEKAFELIMRHLGMLNDKVDLSSGGKPIEINVQSQNTANALNEALKSIDR